MLSTVILCPCRVLYDRGWVPVLMIAQRLPAVRVAASLAFCQGSCITDRVALVTGCAVPCAFLRGAQCTLGGRIAGRGRFFRLRPLVLRLFFRRCHCGHVGAHLWRAVAFCRLFLLVIVFYKTKTPRWP